jgi:hypothetical protein
MSYSTRREFLKTTSGLLVVVLTGTSFDFKKKLCATPCLLCLRGFTTEP